MQVTLKNTDQKKMTKALLKAAYLYCINFWGYEFIFSEGGQLIKEVLDNSIDNPISITNIWFVEENFAGFENVAEGPVYFHAAKEAPGIFVNIPFTLESNGYREIIPIQIPDPTSDGIKGMKVFQEKFLQGEVLDLKVTSIINTLDSMLSIPYTSSWIKIEYDIINGKHNTS